MGDLYSSDRADEEFQAARLQFEHDYAVFVASVRAGTRRAETVELGRARMEARARALAEWAATVKARRGDR